MLNIVARDPEGDDCIGKVSSWPAPFVIYYCRPHAGLTELPHCLHHTTSTSSRVRGSRLLTEPAADCWVERGISAGGPLCSDRDIFMLMGKWEN